VGPAKIVVHFRDGKLIKGFSNDFFPNKSHFHMTTDFSEETLQVSVASLKAIFFVKDFEGDPEFGERKGFMEGQKTQGRKVRVIFQDNRQGFFLTPADPQSNNDRVFVVSAATSDIEFI
jgi:hypothetical protein